MDKALHYELLFRGLRDKYGEAQVIPMFNYHGLGHAFDGGAGSGNFGHAGRLGQVGGSSKTNEQEQIAKEHPSLSEFLGEEFKGYKGQEAINKLLEEKRGHIKAAFHREDIGDIALAWGDEYQGLAHLIKSRTEKNPYKVDLILENLTEAIEKGVLRKGKSGNFEIWHNKIMVIVRPDYYGEDLRFVVTGFKQRGPNKN